MLAAALRRGCRGAAQTCAALELGVHPTREFGIHDTQVRHLDLDPLRRVTQPIAVLATVGVRILPPLAPAPDQAAAIERVGEDADVLAGVAADRRGVLIL